ncbi:MAG: ABC transporter substrate-binding protein [Lentisphaeraceae bacterium]|nr:ABC transporter substrate-binding protein [Lentisphaeraceae bacterium]
MLFRFMLFCMYFCACCYAEELNIYIDADYTGYEQSSLSIEMGIKTALEEHKALLGEVKINVIRLDHKANSLRSLKNIKTFLQDPNRLAIFSGIHSPPLLANRNFINDNKALFLIPWAAASPITRPTKGENWIFRLSVDDSKAGSFLVKEISKSNFKKPYLLLEKTSWGKHNSKTINAALNENKINPTGQEFFNWGPTDSNVRIKVRKIQKSGADCIIFVGNAREGQIFAKTMNELGVQIPVFSHWGIVGGGFYKGVGNEVLQKQPWCFIQTRFSFASSELNPYHSRILSLAKKLYPNLVNGKHIQSPNGFIHAHDLTIILLKAWEQAGKATPVNFPELKAHMENLNVAIEGLSKNYLKPFSKFSSENSDAHEALGIDDLRLGGFDEKGNVILK